ncbi:MAG TPA: vanadium-dependent haloperoxidase, partial [Saprospiraceae bacterium]|nr:vanadium-dependent haloperoxidase [Saprospiraceae bacterium]
SQKPDNPAGLGNLSARLVLECREGDKSNQANRFEDWTGYQPINQPPPVRTKDINHWQPQLVAKKPQKFLTPHWCQVTPFALSKADQFRPPAPVTKEKFAEFKALGDTVSEYSAKLTETQKLVAEYWAGIHEDRHPGMEYDPSGGYWTTPSGQCCRIAGEIAVKREYGANAVVPLFFALTNALLDASIAAWDAKRYYDYVRPVTMIAELRDDEHFPSWGGPCRGAVEMQGEGWCPYLLGTPPFAEYVSGHSCFSAATAEILRCFTGSNEYGGSVTIPTKGSRIEP